MITLRELQEKDSEGMLEWMHDPEIQRNFQKNMLEKSKADVLRFISEAVYYPVEGKSIHYAIADEKDEYQGTISLKNVDLINRNAEYAISLRRSAQGKGIGKEATQKLLEMAFQKFELKRVYLNVLGENIRAIRLYEKCGFVFEGEFRKHIFVAGKYQNLRWYSILDEEFNKIMNQN